MRKELIWVIVIGIFFGLIIAFGVWRINSSMNKPKFDFPGTSPTPQAQISEFKITLNSPENDSVVTSSPVIVTGITKSLTWIVVSGEKGDYIVQSDEKGIFSQDVALEAGINQIKIAAFDPTGSQSIQKVLVVYSSAFQLKTTTPPTSENPASGDAAIKERVAQKVASAMDQPKAYLGVVTDITSTTIQIKTPEAQIEQIAIGSDGITVVNTKGTNNKQVKITDIAIGDFIVAMGYPNGNQVLQAQRILITDPIEDPGLTVSIGKVTKVTSKNLTIADVKTGESNVLVPDKSTSFASYIKGKVSTINMVGVNSGDLVIYVTLPSTGQIPVRSIFDIGGSES
jgi:hypothetical protein